MKHTLLTQLQEARVAKRPCVLATHLASGEQQLLLDPQSDATGWLSQAACNVLRSDKSQSIDAPDGDSWFLNAFNPPLRMAIVGAVHIAQPLARMAHDTGFDVTIVDPRDAFADPVRFPNVAIMSDWPDEALKAFAPDTRTAIITLTHDPKLDDPALQIALASPCFYIGALGSKKTQAARETRLREAGFSDEVIARICGPVGLNIGAKSPAEIAVSIMAQIIQTLRQ